MRGLLKLMAWVQLATSSLKIAFAIEYPGDFGDMGSENLTGASFQTHTFSTRVLTNATHAKFEIQLSIELSELGWIAIGHGTRMSDSCMMIIWPEVDLSGHTKWIISYRSATGHISPKSIRMPEIVNLVEINQLNLINSSNVAFYFTRDLNLTALDNLERAKGQEFVWAISSSRPVGDDPTQEIQYHDLGHGTVILNLGKSVAFDDIIQSETDSLRDLTHSYRHDGLITVHATVLSVAWIFCAPVAIISARFMRLKSSKNWITYHWVLQIFTVILTLIGVICASVAVGSGSHIDSHQKKMGFMVVIGMLFQLVEGYAIHACVIKTRVRRPFQNWLHIFLGISLVLLAWLTIIFGIKEWEKQGRGTPISVSVIMGISMGICLFLYFLGLFKSFRSRVEVNGIGDQGSCGSESMIGISDFKIPERPEDSSLDRDH